MPNPRKPPVRAFIAIAVPESVLKSCQDIMVQLRGLNLQGRFAKTQSIHLTLQYLGIIEEEQIPGIAEILEQAGRGVTPFDLEAGRLGVFPHLTHPRVDLLGLDHAGLQMGAFGLKIFGQWA